MSNNIKPITFINMGFRTLYFFEGEIVENTRTYCGKTEINYMFYRIYDNVYKLIDTGRQTEKILTNKTNYVEHMFIVGRNSSGRESASQAVVLLENIKDKRKSSSIKQLYGRANKIT